MFFENGPWTINPADLTLNETEHGWDVNHHMIFVDQVGGRGGKRTTRRKHRAQDQGSPGL